MKVRSKTTTEDNTNRISALKRLSKPVSRNNNVHQRLSAPTIPIVTDARQLLTNRKKPIFDARQLLSRQSSKTSDTSIIIRKDIEIEEEEEEDDGDDDDDDEKTIVITRLNNGRLASQIPDRSFDKMKNPFTNIHSTQPISFTKTISNITHDRSSQNSNTQSSSFDQKVVRSFANDQYRKRLRSPSPPISKRLHDASIQTAHTSTSSRLSNRQDFDESPIKRNISTNKEQQIPSITSKSSLKQTSTNTRLTQSNADAATILITNLQSSVTEDDVIELFSEIGHIEQIITLSRGCVQVIYSKQEHAEQAVTKYHNRLLDGQLMYVSLQQPSSYSTKSFKNSSSTITKDDNSSLNNNNESLKSHSNQISLDPSFIRQALFNPSNNTANPVQFQVKL